MSHPIVWLHCLTGSELSWEEVSGVSSGVSLLSFLKICVLSSIGYKLWLIEGTRGIFFPPWLWCVAVWCGIWVPRPGIEAGLQRWKQQVLTTRPVGNSHQRYFVTDKYVVKRSVLSLKGDGIDNSLWNVNLQMAALYFTPSCLFKVWKDDTIIIY